MWMQTLRILCVERVQMWNFEITFERDCSCVFFEVFKFHSQYTSTEGFAALRAL